MYLLMAMELLVLPLTCKLSHDELKYYVLQSLNNMLMRRKLLDKSHVQVLFRLLMR